MDLTRGLAVIVLFLSFGVAHAQVARCSKFLHNRDGSWTSFGTGTFLGPSGPNEVSTGERFSRTGPGRKADIARILDDVCSSDF